MTGSIKTLLALGFSSALACSALGAGAHEMFLKPESFNVAPNSKTVVALFNGTIDKSENAITRDRMKTVAVVSGGEVAAPDLSQWRDDAVTAYLDLAVKQPGTYVVAVSTAPKIIQLSADNFEEYLLHDGIEDTLKARQAAKVARTPVRERYSKHVKTIIQVGDAQTSDYAKAINLPAEILLAKNPAAVKVGDTVEFQALRKGEPMAGQLVYASLEGFDGKAAEGVTPRAARLRTDAAGKAAFKVTQAGRWFITLINMQQLTGDAEADYESNWSTLTFGVR